MKKILTLILCSIGIFAIASCGGSDDDDTPDTPEVKTYSEVGFGRVAIISFLLAATNSLRLMSLQTLLTVAHIHEATIT